MLPFKAQAQSSTSPVKYIEPLIFHDYKQAYLILEALESGITETSGYQSIDSIKVKDSTVSSAFSLITEGSKIFVEIIKPNVRSKEVVRLTIIPLEFADKENTNYPFLIEEIPDFLYDIRTTKLLVEHEEFLSEELKEIIKSTNRTIRIGELEYYYHETSSPFKIVALPVAYPGLVYIYTSNY